MQHERVFLRPWTRSAALAGLLTNCRCPAANGTSLGDGLNEGSYSFSSPNPIRFNTTIGRLDYVPTNRHRMLVRGNLQDDNTQAPENFPGQGPSSMSAKTTARELPRGKPDIRGI